MRYRISITESMNSFIQKSSEFPGLKESFIKAEVGMTKTLPASSSLKGHEWFVTNLITFSCRRKKTSVTVCRLQVVVESSYIFENTNKSSPEPVVEKKKKLSRSFNKRNFTMIASIYDGSLTLSIISIQFVEWQLH